jgi:hypothetical protein
LHRGRIEEHSVLLSHIVHAWRLLQRLFGRLLLLLWLLGL